MKILIISLSFSLLALQKFQVAFAKDTLREVIVSHTDEQNILQLYRMKEDGTKSVQLTHSKKGCQMPNCSPNGKKLVYMEQINHAMTIRVCDIHGENTKTIIGEGMNVIPSWMPDSLHIIWMKVQPNKEKKDPVSNAKIYIANTETGQYRRLFSNKEQIKFSNGMPSVSPKGDRIAFVSNRSGTMRIWISDLDGNDAKLISQPDSEYHEKIKAPIEQKVPTWSPDGKWIAHWEGVEMTHMSRFTGVNNPKKDQMIASTFHVWVVSSDGKTRRKFGKGDDPTWSPDGYVTRAFPDPKRGGPNVMIDTGDGEKELPIVPPKKNWGRFTWLP